MQIKQISFYHDFQCVGAACSVNCCRGWKVPIDNAMYLKYITEKGILGALLRCSIEKKEDITAFRSTLHGCPFWGFDRLCKIQKKHGTAYMPAVCRQFPRQLYNLDFFCEETLYLACPEAARLFLISALEDKSFDFTITEGEVEYEVNTTNDDKEFLDYLLQSRMELISMLRSGIAYNNMAILDYGQSAQKACLAQKALPSPKDFISDGYYQIDCKTINTLLFNGFYHPSLRTISPFLYQLCRKYIWQFYYQFQFNPVTADKKLLQLKENLYQKIPELDHLLNRYYEYYLYTNFLDIFEDYSFSKHLLYGIVKTHLLWVFIALFAKNKKQITIEELAKIIAVYERRSPQMEGAVPFCGSFFN